MIRRSFGHKMKAVEVVGAEGTMVHYASVPGQWTSVLCGFEGGLADKPVTDGRRVGCKECLAIVAFFDRARKAEARTGAT